jgi:hypothetical protein
MRTPLEDDLIVKLNRDVMERDLEQLHRKLDEFEQRLVNFYPAAGPAPKPRHTADPVPYAPDRTEKCATGASA